MQAKRRCVDRMSNQRGKPAPRTFSPRLEKSNASSPRGAWVFAGNRMPTAATVVPPVLRFDDRQADCPSANSEPRRSPRCNVPWRSCAWKAFSPPRSPSTRKFSATDSAFVEGLNRHNLRGAGVFWRTNVAMTTPRHGCAGVLFEALPCSLPPQPCGGGYIATLAAYNLVDLPAFATRRTVPPSLPLSISPTCDFLPSAPS